MGRGNEEGGRWPTWAKVMVSIILGYHLAAVVANALAAPPSSELERTVAGWFVPYLQVMDQQHMHRYYVDAPPTEILIATVHFADGRPEQTIRLPDRSTRPRLLYQRQLALAHHLNSEFEPPPMVPEGSTPGRLWAASYARHLCRLMPGAETIDLAVQWHQLPTPEQYREARQRGERLDVESEAFYTVPERIGEFPCLEQP